MNPLCFVTAVTDEDSAFAAPLDVDNMEDGWSMSGSKDPIAAVKMVNIAAVIEMFGVDKTTSSPVKIPADRWVLPVIALPYPSCLLSGRTIWM